MGELLWTCEGGTLFCSEAKGVRLTVIRAPEGAGFRYQLVRPAMGHGVAQLASGHRDDLRSAMEAAERTMRGFASAPECSAG